MHTLDNPAWHALTGPQATVAERVGSAARYESDVSVFAALPDDAPAEAWDDLRALIGPDGAAFLARNEVALPDGWSVHFERPCRQMWLASAGVNLAGEAGAGETEAAGPMPPDLREALLGPADVPEMLALVQRTEPGPFVTRTVELGTYLGIRDAGGVLVAMAGERMHPPGFTEISAVCTDPAHRGRGLASRLVTGIAAGIRARGEIPFLHLTLENEPAHRIYAALGFETRSFPNVVGVRPPR